MTDNTNQPIAEVVDEQCENLQLQVAPIVNTTTPTSQAHKKRAIELHKRAVGQTADLFETLNAIREEKSYLSLGQTSFENYVKALKREAEYLTIDVTTFYRKLAHREVKQNLQEAGIDTRNLKQEQSALVNKLPPALQSVAYALAQKKSDEEPPRGKAAEFHHPGKVYKEKLIEAIEETIGTVIENEDAFENEEPLPEPDELGDDFPSPPASTNSWLKKTMVVNPEPVVTPLDDSRELATFEYAQYPPHSQVVFCGFTFKDGRQGEVWIPHKVLCGLLNGILEGRGR